MDTSPRARTVAEVTDIEELINLTGRTIHVRVDGDDVALPEGPAPVILEQRDQTDTLSISSEHGTFTLAVNNGAAATIMFLPEQVEGTAYLVDAAILCRFPHRDDFYSPATYTRERKRRDRPESPSSHLWSLYSTLPAVEKDTAVISNADFDAATPAATP